MLAENENFHVVQYNAIKKDYNAPRHIIVIIPLYRTIIKLRNCYIFLETNK